jgi:SAM-dependent methyltransferase
MRDDETPEFWSKFPQDDLINRVAGCHRQRRELMDQLPAEFIKGFRAAIAAVYLKGSGIEVGAGDRPIKVPEGATVYYGDIRDADGLKAYFGAEVAENGFIDAQTFRGVADGSQDFVISAHVIEHLWDPVGSIVQTLRVLKAGGYYLLIVPDMRFTFDVDRPETSVEHALADHLDGGAGTVRQAYEEHLRYVHTCSLPPVPEEEMPAHIKHGIENKIDVHVHAWTHDGFLALLEEISKFGFEIAKHLTVGNENIFILRKLGD